MGFKNSQAILGYLVLGRRGVWGAIVELWKVETRFIWNSRQEIEKYDQRKSLKRMEWFKEGKVKSEGSVVVLKLDRIRGA